MCCPELRCLFFKDKKLWLFIFQTNILESFCGCLSRWLLSFSRKAFSPFPPRKQPHLGTCFYLLFLLGGGVGSSCYYPCYCGPCCFCFWPHSSNSYCICLIFWFVFSSFLWLLVWYFLMFADFSWYFLFFLLLWVLLFCFFHFCSCFFFHFSLIFVVDSWCCCFLLQFLVLAFFLFALLSFCFNCCCICGVFLVLVLPLAFSLVFLSWFSHIFSFSRLLVCLFSLYNLRWSQFWLPLFDLSKTRFLQCLRVLCRDLFWWWVLLFRKHYKNWGFSVFWHPQKWSFRSRR